ncbi:GNAT family N-acetyltransferase [Halobacillus sp. Marseille-P3879]|uniref:GNAT family N-acetyltransferase n=1 Tax=Halobacillus sp. Marseille-P3879 TaxID=2045014 RepID=UPI0011AED480|nr:GNAT family N-acetyltransferase [Halobacillus sp. Marseille-P3879]
MADIQEEKGRFYIIKENQTIAELIFEEEGSDMIITHTEVNPEDQGEGLATELVEYAVQYARENDVKIKPVCAFAEKVLSNDPKHQDVLKD